MNDSPVLFLHPPQSNASDAEYLSGFCDLAATEGWLVKSIEFSKGARAEFLEQLAAFWHPQGIIVLGGPANPSFTFSSRLLRLPIVFIDWSPEPPETGRTAKSRCIAFVSCDNAASALMAAKRLMSRDFAAFAYVSAWYRALWSEERETEFRRAVELNGKPFFRFDGTGLSVCGAAATRRLCKWLEALPKPCGLFVAHDRVATEVLSAALKCRISVPKDLSVLSVDDDAQVCESATPTLSSIHPDFRMGGRMAGELLRDLLAGRTPPSRHLRYGVSRVVGRSSDRALLVPSPTVMTVLDYIRHHATERHLSSADILPMLGGSRRSAEVRFRAATGKGIFDEILACRFDKVTRLLTDTTTNIAALADLCGFTTENQLQRIFRRHFGMSLTAYRTRHQAPLSRTDLCASSS